MKTPEAIESQGRRYYAKSATVFGLKPEEAAKARAAEVNLGHTSQPGEDGHNEYVVAKLADRITLQAMFA